ncbi:hypothetical protein XENOCAPTIV_004530 [Xenoophorus captivus]|uniref:Uncharacterized protein n=1 Tax=Xenoophorus captivus TaxID=1517983 RepID=A0ABV0QCP2_9TELE
MDKIIKEKKTSSRIRFMLQDVLDLRKIHKEAEMEEHREQIKVQQQLLSKKESRGPHTPARGRAAQPQDEGWNTVPISKNRPIDITRLSKITKEALQCVAELNSASLLYVFARTGLESTLERSTIARERMGLLLHQLVEAGTLPIEQYYKGLLEILEVAEDMAIDIPHIWLYLAELITPMLHDGGIPMGQLFREISKPLVPLGKAGLLLAQILKLLCKGMVHLLLMFFNTLYDEDVIDEEVFFKWESSKDPAEQTGKGVALKSVTGFFTFLRNAEEESDKD